MKKNKTLRVALDIAGVSVSVAMAFAGWYVGIVGVLIVWAVARAVLKPSGGGGIIGIDHVDRPHTRSYGGGFSPGGLFGVSGLGPHFGVYGADVADHQGPRKEYAEVTRPVLPKKQSRELSEAIKDAEARTGHQILAFVGSLGDDHAEKADRIAAEWPAASVVVCIDPARRTFELRWRDTSFAMSAEQTAAVAESIRRFELKAAIEMLAGLLPVQTAGAELPDIVEE